VIKACKKSCAEEYFTDEPLVLPPPPNDAELGNAPDNPGESCIDIMKNGGKPHSAVFNVKKGADPFQVYCD